MQVDCLPKLVRDQWQEGATPENAAHFRAGSVSLPMIALDSPNSELYQSQVQHLATACPQFRGSAFGAAAARSGDTFCSAYVAPPQQLCRRVNTLPSLLEVNREMASSEAGSSSSYSCCACLEDGISFTQTAQLCGCCGWWSACAVQQACSAFSSESFVGHVLVSNPICVELMPYLVDVPGRHRLQPCG